MKRTIPTPSRYSIPIISNIEFKKSPVSIPFKFNHNLKFRHKFNSRLNILNEILPKQFKLSDHMLFKCLYLDNQITFDIHYDSQLLSIEQNKIIELGSSLLILRLYNYLLNNRPDFKPIQLVDIVNPMQINTLKIRHDFINQFNSILDSKNKLVKIKASKTSSHLRTLKIVKTERHKLVFMLIGLIHFQYGMEMSKVFVDDWIIKGNLNSGNGFDHKGMIQLYVDKKLNIY